jgi:hypothetical protein
MKYKIKYKGLDDSKKQLELELELIEKFYRDKPNFNRYDLILSSETKVIEFTEGTTKVFVSVNYKNKTIVKALYKSLDYVPFTKEELKFFDSLDYEINPAVVKETKQDITDWLDM